MNKRVCKAVAVLAAVILTLCGCQKPAPQPDTDGFTCRATVRYREMDAEGTLTCTEDGKMTLNFMKFLKILHIIHKIMYVVNDNSTTNM